MPVENLAADLTQPPVVYMVLVHQLLTPLPPVLMLRLIAMERFIGCPLNVVMLEYLKVKELTHPLLKNQGCG